MKYFTMLVALLAARIFVSGPSLLADEREDFFEAKIRPVLAGTCFRCHGDAKLSGALRIDSREALLKGGDSGPALATMATNSSPP